MINFSISGKGKKSAKTAKKMTKKKKGDETKMETDQLGDSDEENKTNIANNNNNTNADDDKDEAAKEKKNPIADLTHYKPAFRELDMEVNGGGNNGSYWLICCLTIFVIPPFRFLALRAPPPALKKRFYE